MLSSPRRFWLMGVVLMATATLSSADARGVCEHAAIAQLKEVDVTRAVVRVKTESGQEHVMPLAARAEVRGYAHGNDPADLLGEAGAFLLLHFETNGAFGRVLSLEYLGRKQPQTALGRFIAFERPRGPLLVEQSDGLMSYDLAERVTIDTCDGLVALYQFQPRPGDVLRMHYSRRVGRNSVHLLEWRTETVVE